jgi:hypothetical protein
MKKTLCCFLTALLLCLPVSAQDTENRLERMEKMLLQMQKELQEKDSKINELEKKVTALNSSKVTKSPSKETNISGSDQEVMDQLINDNHQKSVEFHQPNSNKRRTSLTLGQDVNSFLETLNMSAIFNIVGGTSSVRDSDLEEFQGGGHDPKKRGFSLQQLELSINGTIDNLFDAEAHIVFTEEDVELEEAFLTTRSLPANLQLKAGYFLTEFGITNPQHLHSWDFVDQPIINTRLFGGEGMRDAGLRLSWLAPTSWYSEFMVGVQNSDGDRMQSFRGEGHAHGDEEEHADEEFEEGVAGRPYNESDTRSLNDLVWLTRWVNSFNVTEDSTLQLGVSNLYGDNHTGGETWIYGADAKYVIEDKELGRADWVFQGEIMKRNYQADAVSIEGDHSFDLPSDEVDDWGFYVQGLKAINKKWSVGLRYEYATGSGDSFEEDERISRDDDFDRSDRTRISPLLVYQHSEFTKLRLQYNMDDSDAEGNASTIWLGVEVILGSHPAHKF